MSGATVSRQTLKKPATPQASSRLTAPSGLLQRESAEGAAAGMEDECDECRENELGVQPSVAAARGPALAPPIVHEVLSASGEPLDATTRAFMEPRFGHDFGHVRVHTDAQAAESAQAVAAHAYTVGSEVVFGARQYTPETENGRKLLAHELTHVVQQGSRGRSDKVVVGPAGDASEQQADALAAEVVRKDWPLSQDGSAQTALDAPLVYPAGFRVTPGRSPRFAKATADGGGQSMFAVLTDRAAQSPTATRRQ